MHLAQVVPHSAGTHKPTLAAPEFACDSHMHVYDRRFGVQGAPDTMIDDATADDYRLLQRRTGTQRTVVVQPRVHGTDNSVTLAAIRALGAAHTRGVAVVRPDVSDAELERLHAGGVRGIRFTLYTPTHATTDFAMVEPLAHRVHALGWHVQLHDNGRRLAPAIAAIEPYGIPLVIDHFGRPDLDSGVDCPGFQAVLRAVARGRCWVKMSADFRVGPEAMVRDLTAALLKHAGPERLLWGSDWPFAAYEGQVTYDQAVARFSALMPDPAVRDAIHRTANRFYFSDD